MEKKWIQEGINIGWLDIESFNGPIDEVIERIQEWKRYAEELGYRKVRICVDQYYEDISVNVMGERLETDKELAKRQKRSASAKTSAKVRKEKKKAQELKTLKRLKKKYE